MTIIQLSLNWRQRQHEIANDDTTQSQYNTDVNTTDYPVTAVIDETQTATEGTTSDASRQTFPGSFFSRNNNNLMLGSLIISSLLRACVRACVCVRDRPCIHVCTLCARYYILVIAYYLNRGTMLNTRGRCKQSNTAELNIDYKRR